MKKIDRLFLIFVIPILFNVFVYYGFNSAYNNYRYVNEIPEHYFHTIYGYRILSRELLVLLNKFLIFLFRFEIPFRDFLLQKGTIYYHSIFLFNTFFVALSSFSFYHIMQNSFFDHIGKSEKIFAHLFLFSLLSLSQYVVTPYDNSALFLFLLSIDFILDYLQKEDFKKLIIISIIVAISTLNRETSFISVSFLGCFYFNRNFNFKDLQKLFRVLIFPSLSFLATYFILRLSLQYIHYDAVTVHEGFYLKENFTRPNEVFGWIFALSLIRLLYVLSYKRDNKYFFINFLIFISPYLVIILLVGILWEIRLYVPLFFGFFIISQMKISRNRL